MKNDSEQRVGGPNIRLASIRSRVEWVLFGVGILDFQAPKRIRGETRDWSASLGAECSMMGLFTLRPWIHFSTPKFGVFPRCKIPLDFVYPLRTPD